MTALIINPIGKKYTSQATSDKIKLFTKASVFVLVNSIDVVIKLIKNTERITKNGCNILFPKINCESKKIKNININQKALSFVQRKINPISQIKVSKNILKLKNGCNNKKGSGAKNVAIASLAPFKK